MAKKRPSVQKRQREYLKRQREMDKAAKAEDKRQRRQERAEAKHPPEIEDLDSGADPAPDSSTVLE